MRVQFCKLHKKTDYLPSNVATTNMLRGIRQAKFLEVRVCEIFGVLLILQDWKTPLNRLGTSILGAS